MIVSRNIEKLNNSANELSKKTGRQCIAVQADVRDFKSMQNAVVKAMEVYGKIDIVVCGAAGNFLAPVSSNHLLVIRFFMIYL